MGDGGEIIIVVGNKTSAQLPEKGGKVEKK